jgi:hypothetical protein
VAGLAALGHLRRVPLAPCPLRKGRAAAGGMTHTAPWTAVRAAPPGGHQPVVGPRECAEVSTAEGGAGVPEAAGESGQVVVEADERHRHGRVFTPEYRV